MNAIRVPAALDRAKRKREELVDALFTRPESLSEVLPYNEYLPEHQVFVMKDGSLGAFFELGLLEHEPMTSKEIVEAVASLKSLFQLPESCVLQILFDQLALTPFDPGISKMEQESQSENKVAS